MKTLVKSFCAVSFVLVLCSCGDRTLQPWDNGYIRVNISNEFSENMLNKIYDAIEYMNVKTNVTISQTYDSGNFICKIIPSDKNSSRIGQVSKCVVKLVDSDTARQGKDIILHEFGHMVGLRHEHNRPDRNRYIRVQWENIKEQGKHNFRKTGDHLYNIESYSYDYRSLMHYDLMDFSKNGKSTIVLIDYKLPLGWHRNDFSYCDIQKINEIYPVGKNYQTHESVQPIDFDCK